ncbi:MAG: hypothetical protein ACKPKO_07020, partial [Candidatus Fonsibacter sp.]
MLATVFLATTEFQRELGGWRCRVSRHSGLWFVIGLVYLCVVGGTRYWDGSVVLPVGLKLIEQIRAYPQQKLPHTGGALS